MGRVCRAVKVGGRECWALFDSGAENTYVARDAASSLARTRLPAVKKTSLGGKRHRISEVCTLRTRIEGKSIMIAGSLVVDRIGRDERTRREFEVLVGARAMQDWGIELDLKNERLDLHRYPGEFVEF